MCFSTDGTDTIRAPSRRLRRKLIFLAAVIAACCTILATPAAADPAEAEPPGWLDPEEHRAWRDGETLGTYFDRLSVLPGFQSGGIGTGADQLEFYWHGEVPIAAWEIITEARTAGRTVDIRYVPYSYDEIWDHAIALATAADEIGIRLWGFGPNREHDAIEVIGPRVSASSDDQLALLALQGSVIPADMGIEFLSNEQPVVYDSRHADSGTPTPGGQIGGCSGGIGMRRPGVGHYLLTAAHCVGFSNGVTLPIPGGNQNGVSTFVPTLNGNSTNSLSPGPLLDAALISYVQAGASVDVQMFHGPNTSSSKVDINNAGVIPWGVNMCSSGPATGLRCNFVRTSNQVRRCIVAASSTGSCLRWADIVGTESVNGTIMFGGGDSGGPIYRLASGSRNVVAVVQGGTGTVGVALVPCGSANYYPDQHCSILGGRVTAVWSVRNALEDAGFTFIPNIV